MPSWLKAHHDPNRWEKIDGDFNQVQWMVDDYLQSLESEGYQVRTEGRNFFVLLGVAVTLAGKPDLIATK